MGIREETRYVTSDGKSFANQGDAQDHELGLMHAEVDKATEELIAVRDEYRVTLPLEWIWKSRKQILRWIDAKSHLENIDF